MWEITRVKLIFCYNLLEISQDQLTSIFWKYFTWKSCDADKAVGSHFQKDFLYEAEGKTIYIKKKIGNSYYRKYLCLAFVQLFNCFP